MCTPILLLFAHAYYAFCLQIAIRHECRHHPSILTRNAYYRRANNKRIGACIQDRIYLNRCAPFLDVSLWNIVKTFLNGYVMNRNANQCIYSMGVDNSLLLWQCKGQSTIIIIFTYDNSYHNFPTPSPPPLTISSSFLDKNEIEKETHLDVIQVIW